MNTHTESILTRSQYKTFGPVAVNGYGPGAAITALVRYDDQCGNGHNSFSITGTVRVPMTEENFKTYGRANLKAEKGVVAGGCLHKEIAEAFPELAPLIKWHLTSSDGPMHYVENTTYHASNRDHWGKLKGEPRQWEMAVEWKNFPIKWHSSKQKFLKWLETQTPESVAAMQPKSVPHREKGVAGKYQFGDEFTLSGCDLGWGDGPFDSLEETAEFIAACALGFTVVKYPCAWGEGKERDLDAARNAAVWPEATDAELMQEKPELKAALLARLPALLAEFKAAVESLGFTY